jgi:hypothetical protein
MGIMNMTPRDQFTVWFTPLYLNFNEGALNVSRMDMLIADAFPIATWGKVDFASNKVRMIIGLTGQALSKAFGANSLDSSYILQVPLKGTIDNPYLETAKVAAKIAALTASNMGGHGALVGAGIDLLSGGLKDDKVPEPTTQPLPWGNLKQTAEPKAKQQEEKPKDKEKKPKKVIEEGAKSLLKGLFGKG